MADEHRRMIVGTGQAESDARRPRGSIVPWSPAVFLAGAVPLILVGLRRGRGQFDEEVFHLPTIRRFASQMARGLRTDDLGNYLSATTPGYHLALAALSRWAGDSLVLMKLVSAGLTVALLWVLERWVGRRLAGSRAGGAIQGPGRERLRALALVAPVAGSMYVFVPGVWLQPDNAGWLGVLVIMLIGLRPRWDWWSPLAGGAVMFALVWTRQAHVWAAGVLWAAAWMGSESIVAAGGGSPAQRLGSSVAWLVRPSRDRVVRLLVAVAATLPALGSLAWLARMWGGLTPPYFHKQHGSGAGGWNGATPAFALALVGIFSWFFGAWVWPGLAGLWRARRSGGWLILIACGLMGLVAAAAPETTFLSEPRSTGLWNVVRVMDGAGLSLSGRTSPLLLILAPMGVVAMGSWLAQLPRRCAWVHGLAMIGFVAAQSANTNAWQRYLEPFVLMSMALMAAEVASGAATPGAPSRWRDRTRWAGPALLGALGVLVTAVTLWREPVFVKDWPDDPLALPEAQAALSQEPEVQNRIARLGEAIPAALAAK